MQEIIDTAIVTRSTDNKRCLKTVRNFISRKIFLVQFQRLQRSEMKANAFAQAKQIAYAMGFNRRRNQYSKFMGKYWHRR